MAARRKLSYGNIVQIPLSDGSHGYGRILDHPLIEFFDLKSENPETLERIGSAKVAFRVWVMDSAVTSGRWKIVGVLAKDSDDRESPWFFKQDRHSKKLSLYRRGEERAATVDECINLERAAVWSAEHVESRLEDHMAGRKNKWTEALRIET